MSKLKGLLDLQEEIVNYKTEEDERAFNGGTPEPKPPLKGRTPKNHEL